MATGEKGFTLLGLLFLVAGLGIALAALGTTWHTAVQREKERELLFVGGEFRRAIAGYHGRTPATDKQYPESLEDLLADNRFPDKVRHLRRIYRDPLTGRTEWGLVKGEGERIVGVYSLSEAKPLKTGHFPAGYDEFAGAASYREWVFRADTVQGGDATEKPADAAGTRQPAAGDSASGAPARDASNPCLQERARGNLECLPLYQLGDQEGCRACRDAVLQQYAACMEQR